MTPTQGEHAQTETPLLQLAALLENDQHLVAVERREVASGIRRLVAQVAALTAAQEMPKCEFLAHGCDTPSYCQSVQRCTARDEKRATTAQPAAPQGVAYKDSTQDLHVGDGSFEPWYADYVKEGAKGLKQHCRDAYAAGMGDPLVMSAHTAQAAPAADYDHGPQSTTVDEAARHVGKWLNERPNRPLDLRDVAMLVAHAQAPAAGAVAGWQWVPVEPTEAMFTRFSQQIEEGVVYVGGFLQAYRCMLDASPTPAAQADSQPAPQGETNVQLDTDSNSSAPGQQRDVAGSVALGQPMGNGQDQAAGNPGAQRDKLLTVAERNIRSFLRSAVFKSESDREAALNCVDVLRDAARAPADSVLEDAARWNEVLHHVGADNLLGGAQYVLRGIQAPMNVMPGSVAQHFTKSIDAARKQGAKHD